MDEGDIGWYNSGMHETAHIPIFNLFGETTAFPDVIHCEAVFNKDGDPRDFRLGAFADLKVWNPENKEISEDQRPLFPVKAPPFAKDRWTHVLFTWSNFKALYW